MEGNEYLKTMRKPLYKVGDKIKIVKYGSLIWIMKPEKSKMPLIYEDEKVRYYDMHPEIVGKTGTIREVTTPQGRPQYAIDGIKEKSAWYSEEQMKKQ